VSAKFKDISYHLVASLLDISGAAREYWWMNQGMHNISENGYTSWDALYDTTP
jgi:hypothetical protein